MNLGFPAGDQPFPPPAMPAKKSGNSGKKRAAEAIDAAKRTRAASEALKKQGNVLRYADRGFFA